MQFDDPESPPRIVKHNAVSILADISDYNQYCYYVAGTVGYMATEIVAQHYGFSSEVTLALTASAEACGRSLQKTNIIKDYPSDLQRGISYLPATWLEEVGFAPLSLQGAATAWKHKANCQCDGRFAHGDRLCTGAACQRARISHVQPPVPATCLSNVVVGGEATGDLVYLAASRQNLTTGYGKMPVGCAGNAVGQ